MSHDVARVLTYVEIDVDYCSLIYGVAPCEAELGVTGDRKCFNTLRTCQDRNNFDNEPVTLRFGSKDASFYAPAGIEAIPSLLDVSMMPATISLGENLGQRATVQATLEDHRWPDTGPGYDKYVTERGYDPFKQGTFWGKFRARQPYLRGRPMRLVRGLVGQALEDMETRHYVIDSFDGPTPDGTYTLVAKDVLKLADDERAQAPRANTGMLVGNITNTATSATLSPTGIGNLEYPSAPFYAAIGGREIVEVTARSGDALTIVRGQLGTVGQAHSAQDRVQVVLRYEGEDPADIIADLLENYAGVPTSQIPIEAWRLETATYLGRLYTAAIAEPTGVNALISELVEQAALAIWGDELNQVVQLRVLRETSAAANRYTPENTLERSLQTKEQPETRLSQVWTYYGRANPLRPLEEADNYRSLLVSTSLTAEVDYGSPQIRKIFSRWIPPLGSAVAERLNDIQLSRFRDPPRRFSWEVLRYGHNDVVLGAGYRLEAWPLQDDTGAPASVPVQVIRLNPTADRFVVEAQEIAVGTIDPVDLVNRVISIDANFTNFKLRDVHDGIFPEATDDDVTEGVNLTVIVESGVIVNSKASDLRSFDVGSWPTGFPITLLVYGGIQGHGGVGGSLGPSGSNSPGAGGTALYTRFPITLIDSTGKIYGGGGGGGGARGTHGGITYYAQGGPGAGTPPGGPTATATNGGPGQTRTWSTFVSRWVRSGPGGNAGQNGGNGSTHNVSSPGTQSGAAGGRAIDGISFVTTIGAAGDRRGGQVN